MQLLQNTSLANLVNRYLVAGLTVILLLTSSNVQVVEAAESGPAFPDWLTETLETTFERGLVVPEGRFKNELGRAVNKPKPRWNIINSPDLETKPERSDEPAVRTLIVPATAYTSDPYETDDSPFTTANGSRVRDSIVAANFLPFGTRFRIPDHFGNKVFEVHDRMNARYWQRIDIWMLKKQAARDWGYRNVRIEILP